MHCVMIDCETLGTTADAVILSIGAVKFDLNSKKIDDNAFYTSVSVDSNLEHGRRISEATLLWWLKQSPEAQAVFHEAKVPLIAALGDFAEWLGEDLNNPKYKVWSNGADFDLPMMALAFTQVGMEVPWAFYKGRCFRTWKNELPFGPAYAVERKGPSHHALYDAIYQAELAQSIQASMSKAKVAA